MSHRSGVSKVVSAVQMVFVGCAVLAWTGCKSAEERHYEAGKKAAEQGDFNKAQEEYLLCIAANPDNVKAHFRLATIYKEHTKSMKKAREHFYKVTSLAPTYAAAYEALKDIYVQENDLPSAINTLQDGLKLNAWDDKPDVKEDVIAQLEKLKEQQAAQGGAASAPASSAPAAGAAEEKAAAPKAEKARGGAAKEAEPKAEDKPAAAGEPSTENK